MSGFSEKILVKKFQELNSTQHSIQTLSLWLIHHRKRSKIIVNTWLKELKKAKPSRRLTYLYLCNDVVQNCRKKGPEFNMDFAPALPKAFEIASVEVSERSIAAMQRILTVWMERHVFQKDMLAQLQRVLDRAKEDANEKASLREQLNVGSDIDEAMTIKEGSRDRKKLVVLKKKLEEKPPDEHVEPDEVADIFSKLENAPSSDAACREKISSLPQEIADVSALDKIKEKSAAEELSATVSSANALLEEYNGRLSAELEQRQQLEQWLPTFIRQQRDLLKLDQVALKEAELRLSKVSGVRKELKAHIQSLPDLSLFAASAQPADNLNPLPKLHELFSDKN